MRLRGFRERFHLLVLRLDLLPGCLHSFAEGRDQRLLLRFVSLQIVPQDLHLGNRLLRGRFLGVLFRNRDTKTRQLLLHIRNSLRLLI